MGVMVSSSNPRRVLLRDWVRDMDVVLGREKRWYPGPGSAFEAFLDSWARVLVESRVLAGWYRGGGHSEVRVCVGDPVWSFVSRCLGHRLDRRVVLGCPRVGVLCAWAFFGGRWVDLEGVLLGDPVACYLYRGVSGGLPSHLHNWMVMDSSVDPYIVGRYIRDFL